MSKLPIIILHGWGSKATAWDKPKELLENAGYQALVPDLPGFGSQQPPKKPWSVSDYVDFVLRFATLGKLDKQSFSSNKFILIGHSFGGRIAIKLAANYPDRVEKLILTGAAGIRFATFLERVKIGIFLPISKLGHLFLNIFPFTIFSPMTKKILYWLAGSKDYYIIQNSVMKESFKKVINEDLIDVLAKIKVPTYLLWGKDDLMIPLKHAYIMAEKIPRAKLEIIEKANHRFPYEQPEIFVNKVIMFLVSD